MKLMFQSLLRDYIFSALRTYKKFFCFIALVSFSTLAQTPLDIRIALIIGNGEYTDFPNLANPANDANSMTTALTRLGFKVIKVRDGTKEQMASAITQMHNSLKGQNAIAMFYFAGHGLQYDWRNYLVATNSKISKTEDIPKQTIDVDQILQAFKKAGTRLNIVVLDACRDNPFTSEASGKGLTQIDAPINTYIAFATAPGNVALDGLGDSDNGLFTQHILKELQRPAPVEDMFKRVRLQVRKASGGTQIPWDSTSLEEDFAFNDGNKYTFTANNSAKDAEDVKQFNSLKTENPITQFVTQKAEWEKIKRSSNANDFYAYLDKYPNGLIAEQCMFKLNQLAQTKVTWQADKLGILQTPNEQRFRVGDEYEIVTTNGLTGAEIARSSRRVEKIENGLVFIALVKEPGIYVSVLTAYGATVKSLEPNGAYEYDPPEPFLPAEELQAGKKWTTVTMQKHANQEDSKVSYGKVLDFEKINVPAGTFNTYKVVIQARASLETAVESTYWFEPGWGIPIKQVKKGYGAQGVPSYEIEQLVFRKRGAS